MPRKVILGYGISIDGYIARRNGAMDYLVIDKEGEAVMAGFFAKIDTTIMGRKTAVGMVKMRKSGEVPETPGISNYVFSRRWKPGKRDGFEVVSGSLTAFVRKLKRRKGKDIYLGGGGGGDFGGGQAQPQVASVMTIDPQRSARNRAKTAPLLRRASLKTEGSHPPGTGRNLSPQRRDIPAGHRVPFGCICEADSD
jgi:RibD C-terminal domain